LYESSVNITQGPEPTTPLRSRAAATTSGISPTTFTSCTSPFTAMAASWPGSRA
jgi:hypothetical protein